MIRRTATVTESSEVRARIYEPGVSGGLNVGHLRAFVQQADIAGLADDVHVYLNDKLQATSPYHDVEIAASVKESRTDDIADHTDGSTT